MFRVSNIWIGNIYFPDYGKQYSDCEGNVGAGISTSLSVSDGLGPSIFRRKTERTRPMREEMDGRVYISHQSRRFNL